MSMKEYFTLNGSSKNKNKNINKQNNFKIHKYGRFMGDNISSVSSLSCGDKSLQYELGSWFLTTAAWTAVEDLVTFPFYSSSKSRPLSLLYSSCGQLRWTWEQWQGSSTPHSLALPNLSLIQKSSLVSYPDHAFLAVVSYSSAKDTVRVRVRVNPNPKTTDWTID